MFGRKETRAAKKLRINSQYGRNLANTSSVGYDPHRFITVEQDVAAIAAMVRTIGANEASWVYLKHVELAKVPESSADVSGQFEVYTQRPERVLIGTTNHSGMATVYADWWNSPDRGEAFHQANGKAYWGTRA